MKIIPILCYTIICITLPILVVWHARNHSYICKKCGYVFSISILKDFVTPHRYLRCPKCNTSAWQKEIKNKKLNKSDTLKQDRKEDNI